MALESELMASGMPGLQARMIGSALSTAQVVGAAQLTQANGFQIVSDYTQFATVAASGACVLRPASGSSEQVIAVAAGAGNTLTVFPAVGDNFVDSAGAIVAANSALTSGIGVGKVVNFYPAGTTWVVNRSA